MREVVAESPGGQFLGDSTHCSAIGILSGIKIFFRCQRLRGEVWRFLQNNRVDAAVLCDWGAFNARLLLPDLHALGIPVLYYFPPRSWQRTGSPGLGIAPLANRVATPFQWSAERLQAAGCRAEWVGHPSVEPAHADEARPALRRKFGVKENEKLVALLPGSRRSEIRILAPRLTRAAELLQADLPIRAVAVVPRELEEEARANFPSSIPVFADCAEDLLWASDAAIVKMGTASLEAVLAGTPHITVYDVSIPRRVEWILLWAWKRIPFFAMPNIILQREAIPELTGLKCHPDKMAAALKGLLTDETAREQMLRDYALIKKALGSELPVSPTERTAQIVEEMLAQPATASVPAGVTA